jgi:c-di-GMP-binding flagellar brake protein YcgR
VVAVNDVRVRVAAGVRSNHKVRGVGLEFMQVSARCARYVQDLIVELEKKQAVES